MPTFIKTGFWEKAQKGYKEWLNLDTLVSGSVFKILTINTSGQSTTISNFYPAGTDGQNVYIGDGGLLGSGAGADSSYNVSLGVNALKNQTTGSYNVALGWEAGRDLASGGENILIGWQSGLVITTGYQNIFIGGAVGDAMTTGARNTAIGSVALSSNIAGTFNCAFGRNAMRFGATGSENVAIGNDALSNVTGNRNTALGYTTGTVVGTNTNSVFLGAVCNPAASSGTNEVVIGYAATGNGSNTTVIGNTSTLSTRLHGNLLLGTNSNSTYILDVVGTARVTGLITAPSGLSVFSRMDIFGDGVNGVIAMQTLTNTLCLRKYVKVLGDDGGYGNNNASAAFQIDGTNRGFLPPRLTTTQKNAIASPTAGLMIYDTTLNKLCVYTGAAWQTVSSA